MNDTNPHQPAPTPTTQPILQTTTQTTKTETIQYILEYRGHGCTYRPVSPTSTPTTTTKPNVNNRS